MTCKIFLGLFLTLWATGCTFGAMPPPEVAPPTECTSEVHAWENFHVAHDSMVITVGNESGYEVDLSAWNELDTPITLVLEGGGFSIYIREGGDADSPWLGLASVRVDGQGHILSGTVTMNRTLLSKYGPNVAAHVMSQEVGHLLGLDHQRGADDSAMDDCVGRGSGWLACLSSDEGTTPNEHDAEQLRAIYAHASEGPRGPPPACGAQAGTVRVHAFMVPGAGHGY